jgi:hypothetical protein
MALNRQRQEQRQPELAPERLHAVTGMGLVVVMTMMRTACLDLATVVLAVVGVRIVVMMVVDGVLARFPVVAHVSALCFRESVHSLRPARAP